MTDRSPLHLFHKATQLADDVFTSSVVGTTPRQFAVLVAIDEGHGDSQRALSERTGIDGSTLGEIVRRLVVRNLVRRRRTDRDGRTNVVKLTRKGQRILRQAEPLARKVDQRVLGALPKKSRQRFLDILSAMPSRLSESGTSKSKRP